MPDHIIYWFGNENGEAGALTNSWVETSALGGDSYVHSTNALTNSRTGKGNYSTTVASINDIQLSNYSTCKVLFDAQSTYDSANKANLFVRVRHADSTNFPHTEWVINEQPAYTYTNKLHSFDVSEWTEVGWFTMNNFVGSAGSGGAITYSSAIKAIWLE